MAKKKESGGSIEDIIGEDLVAFDARWEAWDTQVPFINFLTGIGGIPKGKLVIAAGDFMTGKSSIFLKTAATVQKSGKRVILLDYESSYNPDWARELGVDPDHVNEEGLRTFIVVQNITLERGFDIMKEVLLNPKHADEVGLIIVDSIAAMVPEDMLKEDANVNRNMLKAQRLSSLIPQLTTHWLKGNRTTTVAFVNQEKEVVSFNSTGPKKFSQPGGRTPKYFASLMLRFEHQGKETEKVADPLGTYATNELQGLLVRVTTEKNRAAFPGQHTTIVFREGEGIDVVGTTLRMAIAKGIVEKNGSWYVIPAAFAGEDYKRQGEAPIKEYLLAHPAVYKRVEDAVINVLEHERSLKYKKPTIVEDDSE